MRRWKVGIVALAGTFAMAGGASLAKETKQASRPEQRVVTVGGKNLCYGSVPATTKCDVRLPAPEPKDKGTEGHSHAKAAVPGKSTTR